MFLAANGLHSRDGPAFVEFRSIDHVPGRERHGGLLSQFTLWLGANLQVTAVVTGALAVSFGGDVWWSLAALTSGQVLGGMVMALHAAQGPRLGLPQMISCRVQFGVRGAAIPIMAVCVLYVGFSASGSVLAGQAIAQLLHIDERAGIALFGAVVIGSTALGYRVIHLLGSVSSIVGVAAFTFMFWRVLGDHGLPELLRQRHFSISQFLLAMSLSASWQIAYGPYVADYSRYLPLKTSPAKVFLAVGLGSVIGSQISMTFGVFAAALAGARFEHHEVAYIVSLGGTSAAAAWLYFAIAFGKLVVTSLNAYGCFMSMATIVLGFRRGLRLTVRHRVISATLIVSVAVLLALLGRDSFLKSFETFILFLLAVFTPWSAINLIDYYCITRSRYDVPALSDPDGRYGRWNATGIAVYAMGILAQLPFMSSAYYTGPLVAALGGADVSWIVGLVLTGALYYVAARRSHGHIPSQLLLPDEAAE